MDIIILIFLARSIGKLAAQKGLRPSTWQIYLVVGWIMAELVGIALGVMIFGTQNMFTVILIALGSAFSVFFMLRSRLESYPDAYEDEIDNIGQ